MEKHRTACVNCGETQVRKRRTAHKLVSHKVLRRLRRAGVGCSAAGICLLGIGLLLGGGQETVFVRSAAVASGLAIFLFTGWWLLPAFPLRPRRKRHYKCTKCGHAWDV